MPKASYKYITYNNNNNISPAETMSRMKLWPLKQIENSEAVMLFHRLRDQTFFRKFREKKFLWLHDLREM